MTEIPTLAAKTRNPSRQENRSLQNDRQVLGVVYGHRVDPVPVSVDASDILKTYRKAGNSTLVELDIEGKKTTVLLKAVSLHPVRHEIDHVDFFAVNLKEKTTVNVDLEFIGKSAAVDTFGGVFVANHRSIDIRCLPTDSPRNFEVDKISLEEIGDQITIKDLNLDKEKYEIFGLSEEEMLCSVIAKKIEEEPVDAPEEGETEAEGEEGEEKTEEEGSGEKSEKKD